MTKPDNVIFLNAPHRLPGLTVVERFEFENLDAQLPLDERGQVAWAFEGQPTNQRERRWLELFNRGVGVVTVGS